MEKICTHVTVLLDGLGETVKQVRCDTMLFI